MPSKSAKASRFSGLFAPVLKNGRLSPASQSRSPTCTSGPESRKSVCRPGGRSFGDAPNAGNDPNAPGSGGGSGARPGAWSTSSVPDAAATTRPVATSLNSSRYGSDPARAQRT